MDLKIDSTVVLNNGVKMPRFGLGTARMTDPQVVANAVKTAIQLGYRLVDTSKNYDNEEWVGRGIRESGVPEDQIFLTTKLEEEDYGREGVPRGFEGSLKRLGLQTIDLYLIHAPERDARARQETWQAMLNLLNRENCRAVGVSNFEIHHLQEIEDMALPTVNQIELTPFNYSKQRKLVEYCQERHIYLMAYSPLGVGEALDDPRLQELARRHGKTPAQVLIRWSLEHDFIVIPKSDEAGHIKENANVFDFSLSPDEVKDMDRWSERQ